MFVVSVHLHFTWISHTMAFARNETLDNCIKYCFSLSVKFKLSPFKWTHAHHSQYERFLLNYLNHFLFSNNFFFWTGVKLTVCCVWQADSLVNYIFTECFNRFNGHPVVAYLNLTAETFVLFNYNPIDCI